MACLAPRVLAKTSVRGIATTSQQNFFFKQLYRLPEKSEHCTGQERKEYELIQSGNDDPWLEKGTIRKAVSTKADPNIVYGAYERRLMGCLCNQDAHNIAWWWLWKGEPVRCMCGHWFKLEYITPVHATGQQTSPLPEPPKVPEKQ